MSIWLRDRFCSYNHRRTIQQTGQSMQLLPEASCGAVLFQLVQIRDKSLCHKHKIRVRDANVFQGPAWLCTWSCDSNVKWRMAGGRGGCTGVWARQVQAGHEMVAMLLSVATRGREFWQFINVALARTVLYKFTGRPKY